MSVTPVTQVKNQPRPVEYDVAEDEKVYTTRRPSSARKYQQPIQHCHTERVSRSPERSEGEASVCPSRQTLRYAQGDNRGQQMPGIPRRRASGGLNTGKGPVSKTIATPVTEELPSQKRFPLLAGLLGMSVAILLVVGLSVVGSWWRVYQDDLHYGRPRTFQFDAVVGHEDSPSNPTHFILINLHRHVEIIELPGGDGAHARIYLGPTLFGDGQDLTPITGEVRDVNGDGKPDLFVHIQDQTLVFINDGTEFRPQQPGDHVHL